MKFRVPRPLFLAVVSIVWLVGSIKGFVATVLEGPFLQSLFFTLVGACAAGLWFGIRWVRVPILLVLCVVVVMWTLGLLLGTGSTLHLLVLPIIVYAGYLLLKWDPSTPELEELLAAAIEGGRKTSAAPPN